MQSWYGLGLQHLSALSLIDFFVMPYPGGDERYHVLGGNDLVVRRLRHRLGRIIHLDRPLEAIVRHSNGSLDLTFGGRDLPVRADLVVLALPFTALREVDLSRARLRDGTVRAHQPPGHGHEREGAAAVHIAVPRDDHRQRRTVQQRPAPRPPDARHVGELDEPGRGLRAAHRVLGRAHGRDALGLGRAARSGDGAARRRHRGSDRRGRPGIRRPVQRPCLGGLVDGRSVGARLLRRVPAGPGHALLAQRRVRPTAACTSRGSTPRPTARASSTGEWRAATAPPSRSCDDSACRSRAGSETCRTPPSPDSPCVVQMSAR